ncbi:hypothetical protein H2O64_15405 [Kordia sp. YSTF-M3]|uniref:RHS repeat-associated core domain-containing protein n=2 Tax=Kordia aestuariivivens TaxID=2759037 RepID=A0ABR7QC23_9FLAO|nr:hypothetical protein [Kordia aestuariivivens]
MLLPKRHASDESYRYGFQGQEKDDELKGEGNSLNYKYRMHDPRIGRFFAVDPLAPKYPHYTPYQFSGNKVIHMVELEGLEEATPKKGKQKTKNKKDSNLTVIDELMIYFFDGLGSMTPDVKAGMFITPDEAKTKVKNLVNFFSNFSILDNLYDAMKDKKSRKFGSIVADQINQETSFYTDIFSQMKESFDTWQAHVTSGDAYVTAYAFGQATYVGASFINPVTGEINFVSRITNFARANTWKAHGFRGVKIGNTYIGASWRFRGISIRNHFNDGRMVGHDFHYFPGVNKWPVRHGHYFQDSFLNKQPIFSGKRHIDWKAVEDVVGKQRLNDVIRNGFREANFTKDPVYKAMMDNSKRSARQFIGPTPDKQ